MLPFLFVLLLAVLFSCEKHEEASNSFEQEASMKKVNHTLNPSLRKHDPTSNNANTNNRPYRKQITYKEALLHTKIVETNNSNESLYKNNNNNSLCESNKAKTSIKDMIIDDDEELPDLDEKYNLEKENDEVDNNKYFIQEQIRVVQDVRRCCLL